MLATLAMLALSNERARVGKNLTSGGPRQLVDATSAALEARRFRGKSFQQRHLRSTVLRSGDMGMFLALQVNGADGLPGRPIRLAIAEPETAAMI
jgi:hypothetical protein